MLELRDGLDLAFKSSAHAVLALGQGLTSLERHASAEAIVARQVDHAHATDSEAALDRVAAEGTRRVPVRVRAQETQALQGGHALA